MAALQQQATLVFEHLTAWEKAVSVEFGGRLDFPLGPTEFAGLVAPFLRVCLPLTVPFSSVPCSVPFTTFRHPLLNTLLHSRQAHRPDRSALALAATGFEELAAEAALAPPAESEGAAMGTVTVGAAAAWTQSLCVGDRPWLEEARTGGGTASGGGDVRDPKIAAARSNLPLLVYWAGASPLTKPPGFCQRVTAVAEADDALQRLDSAVRQLQVIHCLPAVCMRFTKSARGGLLCHASLPNRL